ncbi:2-C-methyl-D-erythritol 4-phosphate cytidylyltransferase [Deinococcus yavapaiensis]|uniref:2-C-methyl-D-erythritol 4-phosphate cytidylyltransferase n=1 Tax=Deinococcus yavapaiensis KR-236 TaxID=694435 RepID=A0A318SI76_9DEIO|nr:2-C-methyl-D-erythritol 4-phosphate cytidylyltransferase [Deinococcus yavapaiensis]PYE51092.1 2-C-methyl-D-erythritol 4-phosphate cytidylyltransferase [Deinococcus yavapaiensis KR-236]
MSVAALVPAAGSGTRLGKGPKAFVTVGGKTLLARAVEALRGHVDEVVVATPDGSDAPRGARVIRGGGTRQETVERLLRATNADFVLIHDAARPFLPSRVVHDVLAGARVQGAATVALPVADTLVRGADNAWGELVSRAGLWAVQTPQAFRRTLILEAHEAARREDFEATDDASLVARLDRPVRLVEGDARLFKVTTPSDLALAEALAVAWDAETSA